VSSSPVRRAAPPRRKRQADTRRGAPREALYTIALGGSDREPTKRCHRTEHTPLTAVANHLGAQLQQIRQPHRAANPAGVHTCKPQLGAASPHRLTTSQFVCAETTSRVEPPNVRTMWT
jgi:hypothetical protein